MSLKAPRQFDYITYNNLNVVTSWKKYNVVFSVVIYDLYAMPDVISKLYLKNESFVFILIDDITGNENYIIDLMNHFASESLELNNGHTHQNRIYIYDYRKTKTLDVNLGNYTIELLDNYGIVSRFFDIYYIGND